MGQVEKIFTTIPKPLDWRSFLNHDMPIPVDIYEEVRKLAIQNGLSRAQIIALETLKPASSEEDQKVTTYSKGAPSSVVGPSRKESAQIELKDLSGREIKDIAEIDQRFGDEWPGRIPAQMVGHIIYYCNS